SLVSEARHRFASLGANVGVFVAEGGANALEGWCMVVAAEGGHELQGAPADAWVVAFGQFEGAIPKLGGLRLVLGAVVQTLQSDGQDVGLSALQGRAEHVDDLGRAR